MRIIICIMLCLASGSSFCQSMGLKAREQASLAAFHHWFYFYENSTPDLGEQLSILHNDVVINTSGQDLIGKHAYKNLIFNVSYFVFGQNSHNILSYQFSELSDQRSKLDAKVLVQVMNPQSQQYFTRLLNYQVEFLFNGKLLPEISSLKATPLEVLGNQPFAPNFETNYSSARKLKDAVLAQNFLDTKERNQLQALVYRWYAIFDELPSSEQLAPLIAEQVNITITDRAMTSKAEFLSWYESIRNIPMKNAHHVEHVDLLALNEREYQIDITLVWQQLLGANAQPTSKRMINRMLVQKAGNQFLIKSYLPWQAQVLKP